MNKIEITRNYDLHTAKDYLDYLKSQGFEDDNYDYLDGLLQNINFYNENFDKWVSITVTIHKDYLEELLSLEDNGEEEEVEYDLSRFDVISASIQSHITTEENYFTGSVENIYLMKDANPGGYHTHDLSLFKYVLGIYKDKGVSHEYYILKCHINNLKWINTVLFKTLEKADYVYTGSDIFSIKDGSRADSNLGVYFKHPNSHFDFHVATDCITGEFVCEKNLDIFGKTEEELWEYLMEEYWKKDTNLEYGPYTYLYKEGQTIETWKEILKERDRL